MDSYGELFFTKYDEKIIGTSKRDPLGLQPIWSYYGRRVVKHLTTVSNDIRGFREVLLCLSICASVRSKLKNNLSYSDLILLFEQLFIYSAIKKETKEGIQGILGGENGTVRYRNSGDSLIVSTDKTVLIREISLGYYGRYKTPLTTMGIIDRMGNLLVETDVAAMYGKKSYDSILEAFESFVSRKQDERTLSNFQAFKELYEAVAGKIRPKEKEFWLDKLQITGAKKVELMAACYDKVNPQKLYKDVFDDLNSYPEVDDIEKLEPFLRCLEEVFYKSLKVRNIKDLTLESDLLIKHVDRYKLFKSVTEAKDANSDMLQTRLNYLREKCNPENPDYCKNIIKYHTLVSNQKRSALWLELDEKTGNIQSFINYETDIDIDKWGRDYYLSSLYFIKQGLEAL